MASYELDISDLAYQDMRSIAAYIAHELKNIDAAKKLLDSIDEVILGLSEMPARNEIVHNDRLAKQGIRKAQAQNHLIFYAVDEQERCVHIVRIHYGRQDWSSIL